jgi:putative peptide zinc metalloprotease protein
MPSPGSAAAIANPGVSGRFCWELRPDIELSREPGGEESTGGWNLRDPLRLTFFRTSAAGLDFLQSGGLRGTLNDEAARLRDAYPDEYVTPAGLQSLAMAAVAAGIVRPLLPGSLPIRPGTRSSPLQKILQGCSRILTIRWRGFDPTLLLKACYPWVSWFFTRSAVCMAVLLMLVALITVLLRRDQLLLELPNLSSLLTLQNLLGITLAFVLVRLLHELGHAFTCHHFGGECHELGVFFILFIPVLYCDVSDSWRQSQRLPRLLVAGAGIYTELCIAAVCGLLWACSAPGLLHSLFLNAMLVCSLNTLLINGNPLVRYDGYFVLSDLLGIPNLWSLSRSAAGAVMQRVILGGQLAWQDYGSRMGFAGLTCFGIASFCYRIGLLMTLLTFMHRTLGPLGLQFAAFVPAAGGLLSGLIAVLRRIRSACMEIDGRPRAVAGLLLTGGIALLLLVVPVSLPVYAPCVLTPGVASPVYAAVNGRLLKVAEMGTVVRRGDVIAELANDELELDLAKATGLLRERETALRSVRMRALSGGVAAEAIPVAEQAVASAADHLNSLQQQKLLLIVRSPDDGVILPPRNLPRIDGAPDTYTSWSSQALQQSAVGAWLDAQTLLCWIGDSEMLRVDACVEQTVITRIADSGDCRVRFVGAPGTAVPGQLESFSSEPLRTVDRELLVHQLVAADSTQSWKPQRTMFLVRLSPKAKNSWGTVSVYSAGIARLPGRPVSIASLAWRLLRTTFGWSAVRE